MVKVNTQYSKKLLRNFEIFHFFRKSISKSVINMIIIINLLALFYFTGGYIIFSILYQFKIPKFLLEVVGFLVNLMIAMILPIIYFIMCKRAIKNLKRNYRIEEGMKIEYEFGGNDVKVSLSTPFENDNFIRNYSSIDKIYETSKYFYIYFSKYDLFILPKENLTKEDLSKVQSIFKENLGENKLVKRWKGGKF